MFRLRNDLYCVEWGVKLYSLTHNFYENMVAVYFLGHPVHHCSCCDALWRMLLYVALCHSRLSPTVTWRRWWLRPHVDLWSVKWHGQFLFEQWTVQRLMADKTGGEGNQRQGIIYPFHKGGVFTLPKTILTPEHRPPLQALRVLTRTLIGSMLFSAIWGCCIIA